MQSKCRKSKITRTARGKQFPTNGTVMWVITDFSSGIMRSRRQWEWLKCWKKRTHCQPRTLLYSGKLHYVHENRIFCLLSLGSSESHKVKQISLFYIFSVNSDVLWKGYHIHQLKKFFLNHKSVLHRMSQEISFICKTLLKYWTVGM